jgi:hypothetical protein
MDQKIMTAAVATLALVASYGAATAQPSGLFHTTAALIAPAAGMDIGDQREVITPPSDIDPGMTKMPPHTGARMPIIAPPDGRFGIER